MDTRLNIVVVEDHDGLRDVTVEALVEKGHRAVGVDCAEALQEMPAVPRVDLMIIDLNLPGEDGISLTRRLKESQPELGIIMVTARSQISEKTDGYASGADIYLTKPTSIEELTAAIGALAKRLRRRRIDEQGLRFDIGALGLHGPDGSAMLTALEGTLLAALVRAPGNRLEYWQLLDLVGRLNEGKVALEAPMYRLRTKLTVVGASGNPIKSIRQVGYQLGVTVTIH